MLPALAWDVSYVDLFDPIPDLSPLVVRQYLTITNQITLFKNLTRPAEKEDEAPALTYTFMAANDIELELCKPYQGKFAFCSEYSLRRKCSAGAVGNPHRFALDEAAVATHWALVRTL